MLVVQQSLKVNDQSVEGGPEKHKHCKAAAKKTEYLVLYFVKNSYL